MAATVRIGICSFADEGLLKHWYPRSVSTPAARLAYYGERFDTTEVDSPFYHLPVPAVTGRWAQRTPAEFVFHVKAHRTLTHHEDADQRQAFAEFRASIEPLELSGKLKGILLQYHPSLTPNQVKGALMSSSVSSTSSFQMPDAIKLCYGESDTPTPEWICRAVYDAALAGHTFYTHTAGYPALREAIAGHVQRLHGARYRPSEVMATDVTASRCPSRV